MWQRVLILVFSLCVLTGSQAWAAALSLSSFSPQGQVERLTQVVVRFNAPMRSLGDMSQDAATSPLQVSLSRDYSAPPPAGSYRWLDESTLAYLLEEPQRQAMTLYCRVPAGSLSLAGDKLAKEVAWSVSTPAIAIIESSPEYDRPLGKHADVSLVFNQPLDLASLNEHARLSADGVALALKIKEEPLPPWADPVQQLSRTYTFTTDSQLSVGQRVELSFSAGLRSAQGHTPLAKPISLSYISFAPLSLDDWSVDKSQTDANLYNPESGLSLSFNNPLSGQQAAEKIKLEVKGEAGFKPVELNWPLATGKYITLHPGFAPRQTYRLTLPAGLTDEYGGVLAKDKVLEIKTGDYNPRLYSASGAMVVEGQFPASQTVWLRNIRSFKVTLDYYSKDNAWQIYDWFAANYWKDKSAPPKAQRHKTHLLNARVVANQPYAYELDIPKLLGNQPIDDGVVLLTLEYSLPGEKATIQRSLLQHNDIGLSLKYGFNNSLAWVSSLSQGQSLSGVALKLMDRKGKLLWQGESDANGLAWLPGADKLEAWRESTSSWGYPGLVLLAEKDGQLAVLSTFVGYNSLRYAADSFPDQNLSPNKSLLLHTITQLPLYTPGAQVNYLLYVRGLEGGSIKVQELKNLTLEIKDSTGKVVHSATGDLNSFGSLAGSFKLDDKARLGSYDLYLSQPDVKGYSAQYGVFEVQYYRMPEYKVELNPQNDKLEVKAEYFFGSPVSNAPVKLLLNQQPVDYTPSMLDSYVVGPAYSYYDDEEEQDSSEPTALGTQQGKLDENGRASFELPAWPAQSERPLTRRVSMKAEVTDASGQVVSGYANRLLHPAQYYVGIKAPYLAQAGSDFSVNLLACTSDNRKAGALQVELSLFKRQWDSVRERGVDGFYQTVSKYTDTLVRSQSVELPDSGGQFSLNAPEAGEYIVQSKVIDGSGGEQLTSTYIYIYGQGGSPWQRFSDNSLELVPEKSELKVGETARILVKNPFQQATALITVEREGISRQWVEHFTSSAPMVEVPMLANDAPNTYVSVLLIRGRNGQPPASGPDLAKPQVRLGNVQLKVEELSNLKVEVKPSAQKFKPGQQVEVQVTVSGNDKQPCQVTLLAVDERVLAVAGNKNNYDPGQSMRRELPLKVSSEDSRVSIVDQRFKSGLKGEDAAGGGGLSSIAALRSNFEPDVYWLAQGITDEQGRLNAAFTLPDSLTAYRIVAVAADKGKSFGLGSSQVVASKPLQLLSSLPAFVVMGDKLTARFIVQNLSDAAGRADLSLAVEGVELLGSASQQVELGAGQMKSVDFVCQAPLSGSAQAVFQLQASLGGEKDAASFSIPLMPASQTYYAASAGIAKPGQPASIGIKPPANASQQLNQLDINLALTPASSLAWPIRYLNDYPWMCLEQRTSKALGLAFSHNQAALLGVKQQDDTLARISSILESFANFQDDSGQMYLWQNPGGYEDYFYPYLTAYTLMAGNAIKQMTGLSMNRQVEERAYKFLQKALNDKRTDTPTQAMIIWLLAQNSGQNTATCKAALNSLLRNLKGQDPFTLSCLLLAAKAMNDRALMADLVVRLDKGRVVSGTHLHFSRVSDHASRLAMGSDARDNAMALWALAAAAPNYSGLEGLSLWLADKVGASQWLSTQDAAYTLLGMNAYLLKLNPQAGVKATVSLAGKQLIEHTFAQLSDPPFNRVFNGVSAGELNIASQHGPLYWSSRLQYTLPEPDPQPQNAGFAIGHKISLDDNQEITQVELGQVVQCTITLMVPESRLHVLVFDPIPAGLEPLDATSLSAPEDPGYDWQWVEMRKDGLMLYAWDLEPGIYIYSYKLRASAIGEFVWRGALVEEMYQPENFGRGAGATLTVK